MSLLMANPSLAFVAVALFVAAHIHHRALSDPALRLARFFVLAAGCVWLLCAGGS